MKVKCIKPVVMEEDETEVTTVGKIYNVDNKTESMFSIKDDEGQEHWFDHLGDKDYCKECRTEDHFVIIDHALSCPFCGIVPTISKTEMMTRDMKSKTKFVVHPENNCPLDLLHFRIDEWNART